MILPLVQTFPVFIKKHFSWYKLMIFYVKIHCLSSGIHLNNFIKGIVQNTWVSKKVKNIIKIKILAGSLGILQVEEAPVKTSISHAQLCHFP